MVLELWWMAHRIELRKNNGCDLRKERCIRNSVFHLLFPSGDYFSSSLWSWSWWNLFLCWRARDRLQHRRKWMQETHWDLPPQSPELCLHSLGLVSFLDPYLCQKIIWKFLIHRQELKEILIESYNLPTVTGEFEECLNPYLLPHKNELIIAISYILNEIIVWKFLSPFSETIV